MVLVFLASFMLAAAGVSLLNDHDSALYPLLLSSFLTAILGLFPLIFVERAEEILSVLVASHADDSLAVEQSSSKGKGKAMPKVKAAQTAPQMGIQLSMFQLDDPVLVQIRDQIRGLDINTLTPLEALNTLNEIKKITGL